MPPMPINSMETIPAEPETMLDEELEPKTDEFGMMDEPPVPGTEEVEMQIDPTSKLIYFLLYIERLT